MSDLKLAGVIVDISPTGGTVLLNDSRKVNFTKRCKVRGCQFEYLEVNDKVLVGRIVKQYEFYITNTLELVNITEKWEKILKKDKKYDTHSALKGKDTYIIRPELISPEIPKRSYDNVKDYLDTVKWDKAVDKVILDLFCTGETIRSIAETTTVPKSTCYDIIQKYLNRMKN